MTEQHPFKWRHFEAESIVLSVGSVRTQKMIGQRGY